MLRLAPKSRISGRLKSQFIGESHCFSAPRTAAIVNGTDLCFPITSCPPQAGLSQQSISREMGQNRAHNPLLKISKPRFRHIWPLAKLSAQASRSHQINSKQFNCHARACSGPFGRHPNSRLIRIDSGIGLSLIRRHPSSPPQGRVPAMALALVLELSRALSVQNLSKNWEN